jgi:hypothetical protein
MCLFGDGWEYLLALLVGGGGGESVGKGEFVKEEI